MRGDDMNLIGFLGGVKSTECDSDGSRRLVESTLRMPSTMTKNTADRRDRFLKTSAKDLLVRRSLERAQTDHFLGRGPELSGEKYHEGPD